MADRAELAGIVLGACPVAVLEEIVVLSAEEQLKQALGVSNITAEDLERNPVARDLSELIRKQPGVNLTGNTSSGQYGQSRQIDIRGMGPENTLILIDGKPVFSRDSARMGRQGERDTRGDSNWVPPELIERIEVIRGPAAARYGSGAAGGVVNIITKRPEKSTYSFTTFVEVPESSDEGGARRVTATAGGPIDDVFSYRFTASGTWTDPDAVDINAQAAEEEGLPIAMMGGLFLPKFREIAERHPNLKLILDHCGLNRHGQDAEAFIHLEELAALAKLPNVAVKATGAPHYSTQAYPFRNIHDGLHRIFDAFGPKRMFWGTDITKMPCTWRQCVTHFQEIDWIPDADKKMMMGPAICEWIGWKR